MSTNDSPSIPEPDDIAGSAEENDEDKKRAMMATLPFFAQSPD